MFKSISWVLVNTFGNLRISKTSYFYLVIVPVLVKVLEKVNNPFFLFIGESEIQLNLELPFSWYLFYLGAVSIALGSLGYQIFCPDFIKDFKNYGQFLDAGESDSYLHEVSIRYNSSSLFTHFLGKPYLEEKSKEKTKHDAYVRDFQPEVKETEKVTNYKPDFKYQEDRKNYFNSLYSDIKYANKEIMISSFVLYMIGFLCFTWVIIQNILFVIQHLF